ncbi:hypothetical protein LTR36_001124 [Oleoguttula mirabilis]|uniref:Uncharacterized protein n=1 Tax=Oleoguttula mirabilis TaxID=1507867 RepID=A0AAV9JSH1_9PEZI|nr:hypothetical protein LTR36_001124 [Oleoguttula mirabilis]
MSSLRLLAPRASLSLSSKQLQHRLRLLTPSIRYASTFPPPKPRLLEKPERFNPPSHPSRIRSKPKYYGPDLSAHERRAQKTRQYPHMMPPEGSFMHWFLTNRTLHLYITLGILVSLTIGVFLQDFLTTTPYRDILPPNSMIFAHPLTFFGRWIEVYQMHISYTSAQTAERRKQKVDDVQKRSEYRKAHGINQGDSVLGGWTAKEETESMGPALREGRALVGSADMDASPVAAGAADANGTFVDFEGKQQPMRKKWLGIW